MRNMKAIGLASTAILVLGVAWLYFSPYLAVNAVKRAAIEGNAEDLREYIDLPAVRESLKDAIRSEMTKEMAKSKTENVDNPFAALGMVVAEAMIGPMIDTLVSPAGIAKLLEGRSAELAKNDSGTAKPAGGAPQPDVKMRYEGLGKFVVQVRGANEEDVGFVFRREGLYSWKLVAIRPPATHSSDKADALRTQSEKVNESTVNNPKLEQTTSFNSMSFVPAYKEGYEYFERITIDGMSIVFPKSEKQQAAMLKVVKVNPVQYSEGSGVLRKHGVDYTFDVNPDKVTLGKDYKQICDSEIMYVSIHVCESGACGDGNFDSLSFMDKDGTCLDLDVSSGDDIAIKP